MGRQLDEARVRGFLSRLEPWLQESRIHDRNPTSLRNRSTLANGAGLIHDRARWRLQPAKPRVRFIRAIEVDTIQKKHVEVNVQIEGTSKALDQRDCASVRADVQENPAFLIKCVPIQ